MKKRGMDVRLARFNILLATVPLVIFMLLVTLIGYVESRDRFVKTNVMLVKTANQVINNYFDDLNELSLALLRDSDSRSFLYDWQNYSEIVMDMTYILSGSNDIDSVFYYTGENRELYVVDDIINRSWIVEDESALEPYDWYFPDSSGDTLDIIGSRDIVPYSEDVILRPAEDFSFIKRYDFMGSYSQLSVNIRTDAIKGLLSDLYVLEEGEERVILVNGDGDIIYSDCLTDVPEGLLGLFEGEYGSVNYQKDMVFFIYDGVFDTYLIKMMPRSRISMGMVTSSIILLIFLSILIIILIPVSIHRARKITKPLHDLQDSMQEFGGGNMKASVSENDSTYPELAQIESAFNAMTEEIDSLINEQYRLRMEQQESKMNELLAKMNPHFINNTLNTIAAMGLRHGADDVYDAVTKLATLIRYGLKAPDKVTVQDELNNVRTYVDIQKLRFGDRILFEYDIKGAVTDCIVPKLIIQPLVENSITHGLEDKKGTGFIRISVERDERYLYIMVQDQGKGFSEEALNAFNGYCKDMDRDVNSKHIGLMNIAHRLYLLYGSEGEISVSNGDVGAYVKIRIPVGGSDGL